MHITVIGAGAIGCLLAARLAPTDAAVSLIARGTALSVIRREGIRLTTAQGHEVWATPDVTDSPASLGPQDLVFVCVKSHAMPGVLETLQPLLGPDTRVVPIQNGVPWWYPHGQSEPLGDRPLTSVDPAGALWRGIDPNRIIGATTFAAVEKDGPGRIRHIGDKMFWFGDIAGRENSMVDAIVTLFTQASLPAAASPDIRESLWFKLWGNMAFNPLSVLTRACLGGLCRDPGIRSVAHSMMAEAKAVAERIGIRFTNSIEERLSAAAEVGDFKTSMLQDFEAGRRLETDGIIGAVLELADRTGVDMPMTRAILALVNMLERERDATANSSNCVGTDRSFEEK